MYIQKVKLENFRNYEKLSLEFEDVILLIVGIIPIDEISKKNKKGIYA